MHIAIDAEILRDRHYSGISRMLWNILRIWAKEHPEHTYTLLSPVALSLPEPLPPNWRLKCDNGINSSLLWRMTRLHHTLHELKPDVFWSPNFLLPVHTVSCPCVVTVHDLAWKRYPASSTIGTNIALNLFGKRSCDRASRIITVSQATADDLIATWNIPASRIRVCHNGGAVKPTRDDRPEAYGLKDRRFLLFLSTIEPRKNPVTVLNAYARYREGGGNDYKFVFAGSRGWKLKAFDAALEQHPYRDDILLTGYIDEEEKTWLLQHTRMLLYPSLYEGFGIPILEAFACGTPVITSDISSMPEVGGDAAFYVKDPLDAQEMTALIAMVGALRETELRDLRQRMQTQHQKFSWEKCAEETMKVLEEAASNI